MSRFEFIECNQDNNTLVSKVNVEDLFKKSLLIVDEAQEAIFYKDGQALDLFASGRHQLDVNNMTFIKKFFAKHFGSEKLPFACDVIFVNKVCLLDLIWGTDTPVTVEDPKYHRIIAVRANGQMGVKILDSRKFVIKVTGQTKDFCAENIKKLVKSVVMTFVKESIAVAIVENGVSILEITTQLSKLSDIIKNKVNERLEDIGLALETMYVSTIVGDDNDIMALRLLKDKESELDMESLAKQRASFRDIDAEAYRQKVLGYTYQEGQNFEVLKTQAQNQGRINANCCPVCNNPIAPNSRFCAYCGASLNAVPVQNRVSFCKGCGSPINENTAFCPNCGTKLK